MKIEDFNNKDVHEAEKPHNAEKTLQDIQDHKARGERLENNNQIGSEKKFEDYSYKELQDMAKIDPDKVTKLNADFRERYEAEMRDMTQNEYREYKIEDKLQKFSCINFSSEDSFNNFAKEHYPELNALKCKCVYDTPKMGTDVKAIDRSSTEKYSASEISKLKDIRENIDAPTPETVMQKVICVDTGDIQKDLKMYIEPTSKSGEKTDCQVFGCVSKAEDTAPFTKTPQECFDNLRLDYDPGLGKENPYKNPEQSVYVIRFTDGDNYGIPYSKEFGGKEVYSAPCTGNGFTAAKEVVLPEYAVEKDRYGRGAVVTDGIIYRIRPDGKEEPVAFFNEQDKCFEPLKKGE